MPIGLSFSLNGYKHFINALREDFCAQQNGWVQVNTINNLIINIDRSSQYIKYFTGSFNYDLRENKKIDETHYAHMGGGDNKVSRQTLLDAVETLEFAGQKNSNYSTISPHLRQVCLLISEAARSQVIYRCIQKILHGHEGGGQDKIKVEDFDGLSKNYASTKKANFLDGFQTLDYQHYARNGDISVNQSLKNLSTKLGMDVLG